ncbi:MAG: CBS domain-containing protein [Methanobrevibacter boviskoreani]|jgi:predicted transcriptional regulator|uniref:CBS domain-containing protein n=1 Tax=Methanobrevibacter boviskoreani TaxID=1348249 RepID=UPI0023A7A54E|nr:CBS domain-containing protein [Methanobrevibacter boviskoreani]MCI6774731.1 CBS domain-containing protein [Methanobrevibacter boviskoreani]MCI6931030.1 CBS domain-containing protein [Methanobrevibacter boviskoreani]MDD6256701.1 CBS domain-containing protein [Methanobrevibacter boviskoreani]
MITSVQKEILQNLINLYQTSEGKSIKGEQIAEVMNRNPGTIRNQMQSLRSLGLVKGVPGPRGGYKPTIEAYHNLNIPVSDKDSKVPISVNNNRIEGLSVAKIEFTSVPHPKECEAAIKVLGNIKSLNIGDEIQVGPTPVNNLGVIGKVVGRDDTDNIILLETNTIRSIPKKSVIEIGSVDLLTLSPDNTIREASKIFSSNSINGAPIVVDNVAVGILTVTDVVKAIAENKEDIKVSEYMSPKVVSVNKDMSIANAVEIMYKHKIGRLIITDDNNNPIGIVTRTDLIESMINLKKFPITTE